MLRIKAGARPAGQQHRHRATSARRCVLLLVLAAVAPACWLWDSSWRALLPAEQQEHERPGTSDAWVPAAPPGLVHDPLLDAIANACAAQQDSWISTALTADRGMQHVLQQATPPSVDQGCPLLLIPLAASDRSIGLCMDAALYVNLMAAWIVPGDAVFASDAAAAGGGGASGAAAVQRCRTKSAVLFLEPLYDAWLQLLQQHKAMPTLWAPNFEHVFGYDREAHMRMQLVLCKVKRCSQLMQSYLHDIGSNATLMFTGHTSLDPAAIIKQKPAATQAAAAARVQPQPQPPPQPQPQPLQQPSVLRASAAALQTSTSSQAAPVTAAAAEPLTALHVRGKSGLKHTKQLLDCWIQHPEWPELTVVGPLPNEQVSGAEARHFLAAGNIVVPRPGKPTGPGWPLFDPLSSSSLAALLLTHALHIMPSEREGFGHAINQGRAAGALVVVTDHPPMSELVRPGAGLLIRPERTFSHEDEPVPALGKYGNISASVSPQGICVAVAQALALSPAERQQMGLRARQLFQADRRQFEQQVELLKGHIQQMLATAATAKT